MSTTTQARILCVEDERTLLGDLLEELCAAGYQVTAAASAAEAVAFLEDGYTPDLVLCDVMLGDSDAPDGYFVHQHIRQQRPDLAATPVIFLTALGQRADLLEAKRQGVDDYLVKPVDYDLLLATLAARLAQIERVRRAQDHDEDVGAIARMREVLAQLPGAVLLCDGQRRLHYANHQAQALMQQNGVWRVEGSGRLQWPDTSAASLQLLQENFDSLAAAGQGRRVQALEQRHSTESVLLSLVRLDKGAEALEQQLYGLFLCSAQSRPVPELEALRLLFGLTRSEAKVARLLALGRRTEEVASELSVSAATVAFHLRNLFQKTGVTRQSDLIALILAVGWTLPDLHGVVA